MNMQYNALAQDIKDRWLREFYHNTYVVGVTWSPAEYWKILLSNESLRKSLGITAQSYKEYILKSVKMYGVEPVGSTYAIDLENNISYRFYNHTRLLTKGIFQGFLNLNGHFVQINDFEMLLRQPLSIYELLPSKQIHRSTPLRHIWPVPPSIVNKSIVEKTAAAIRIWSKENQAQDLLQKPGPAATKGYEGV